MANLPRAPLGREQVAARRSPVRRLTILEKDDSLYREEYPASWFLIAPSKRVKSRDRIAANAFGEDLVVWRDEEGQAHVQGRFCPHMGASLANGKVCGTKLVCPFHHWEYDAKGTCTKIPYMDDAKSRIPKRARIRSFPVVERFGFIWAFNGETPTHDLPPLREFDEDRRHFGIRTKTQRFENHPLLILENGCDAQHFKYVHKVNYERYEVEVVSDEAHSFGFDVLQSIRGPGKSVITITTGLTYVGASLIFGRLKQDERHLATFIAAPTPIAKNVTDFTLIVAVKSMLPWWLSFLNPLYYSFFANRIFTGATDDYLPIWRDMDTRHRGVLVEEDRLQQRFRKYYRAHLPSSSVAAT